MWWTYAIGLSATEKNAVFERGVAPAKGAVNHRLVSVGVLAIAIRALFRPFCNIRNHAPFSARGVITSTSKETIKMYLLKLHAIFQH